jgi:hypothetical protein
LVGLAICAAAAFGAPKIVAHAAAPANAPAVSVPSLDMGSPLISGDLSVQDPALAAVRSAANPNKVQAGEEPSKSDKGVCDSDHDNDNDCNDNDGNNDEEEDAEGGGGQHCDGDGDHDDHGCPSGTPTPTATATPTPTPTGGGGEDVCENGGLSGATIGDQLVDAGVPLNEPEATGPISSALVGSGDPLETTPLAPVVNEVACVLSVLTL